MLLLDENMASSQYTKCKNSLPRFRITIWNEEILTYNFIYIDIGDV
jgi:hypothetical protein